MVPELYVHEINKLEHKERQRFKRTRLQFVRADGEQLEVDSTDMHHIQANEESL